MSTTEVLQTNSKLDTLPPFIGSVQGDYDLFNFLIHSFKNDTLEIRVPQNVVNRFILHEWDIILLHIPFYLNENHYSIGRVLSGRWDESIKSHVYEVTLISDEPHESFVVCTLQPQISFEKRVPATTRELVFSFLKEMKLLKEGVSVYMKHLVPYFSRVSGSNNYEVLKELILNEMLTTLKTKTDNLSLLYRKIKESNKNEKVCDMIDFNELQNLVVPEINLDILNMAFKDMYHLPYIVAIKDLTKKIYWNYNYIVMLDLFELANI